MKTYDRVKAYTLYLFKLLEISCGHFLTKNTLFDTNSFFYHYDPSSFFIPMPHFVGKLIMLKNGALKKPIDIFDLFYHSAPLILLIIKTLRDYSTK